MKRDIHKYPDLALVSLLRERNEEAFSEIFNRYHMPLYLYAFRKIGEEEAAKDVVQDVFIRLWSNCEGIASDSKLSHYLYRAIHNRSLDWLKSQTIRSDYVSSFQGFLDEVVEGTDYRIREEDMDNLIQDEVERLPLRLQQVITLRRKEQLSNKEIAERLGLSEQTVETHFKRAFRVLRGKLPASIPLSYFLHWWLSN